MTYFMTHDVVSENVKNSINLYYRIFYEEYLTNSMKTD